MSEEEALRIAGLENVEALFSYPLFIKDGDECWLTAVRKGVRVRLCKVPVWELMALVESGAGIARAIVPR